MFSKINDYYYYYYYCCTSSDIDECKGENDCAKVGGKCINEHGKYRCECEGGFVGDGKICKGKLV